MMWFPEHIYMYSGVNYNYNEKHFLKVHNPRVIILLICINDVQCVIYEGYR